MSRIAQWVDTALEATGMDAVDALRAFFLLAAATVRDAL
jgi:3-oxo-5-alpha-steroid 4-dehydrogenase 3